MKHLPPLVSTLWSVTVLVPFLARAGHLPFAAALAVVTVCGLIALGLSLQALRLRWVVKRPVPPALWAALPLALFTLGPLLWGLLRYPWRNDVAVAEVPPVFLSLEPTETEGSPAYTDQDRRAVHQSYPRLEPLLMPGTPERAFAQALLAAALLPGWEAENVDLKQLHFEGTARSPLLRTETQLSLTIRKQQLGSRIDIRSRSKLPFTDFGENARMIETFSKTLTKSRMCRPPADFAAKRS